MLVLDAGILAVALTDTGTVGPIVRRRLRGEALVAPGLVHAEVLSVIRGLDRARKIDAATARRAVEELVAFPVDVVSQPALLRRCWQLRHNLSAYDAQYVALAEAFGAVLVTTDGRLAKAPGPSCPIEVFDGTSP